MLNKFSMTVGLDDLSGRPSTSVSPDFALARSAQPKSDARTHAVPLQTQQAHC